MRTLLSVLLMLTAAATASARNVDLSTVPTRDTVQLTIYNSEDLTLVRETRKVSFKNGINPLQFSWANTLIDPTSVELRFLSRAGELEVLDTTYPHDKPQMLYWNVQSGFDGEATIEITYFTSGITWAADYLCVASADEATMGIEGFVRVFNRSGEEYENAQVRLVVGTINLVEKIAQLAQISMQEVEKLDRDRRVGLRKEAAKRAMAPAPSAAMSMDAMAEDKPKEIIKEGLSEYFIYTIEGTETIPNGWSKRLRSFDASGVPVKVQYRYRPQQYGDQLVRMYLLTNSKENKLGTTPMPDGMVRVFRDNGRGGLSYLTAQPIKYIPIGDKIELNLGVDPEVIFELIKLRAWRDELWMKVNNADVYRKVGEGDVKIEVNSAVAGWTDHSLFTQRIRNYTGKPIEVEVRRTYGGHVIYRSSLEPTLHDFQTVQFTTTIPAGQKANLYHEVAVRQGYNAKQNNVTLESAQVQP